MRGWTDIDAGVFVVLRWKGSITVHNAHGSTHSGLLASFKVKGHPQRLISVGALQPGTPSSADRFAEPRIAGR